MGGKGKWISCVRKVFSPCSKGNKQQELDNLEKQSFPKKQQPEPDSTTLENVRSLSPPPEPEEMKLVEVSNEENNLGYTFRDATKITTDLEVFPVQNTLEAVQLAKQNEFAGKSKEEIAAIKIQTAFRGYMLHTGYGDNSPAVKKPRTASHNYGGTEMGIRKGSLVSRLRLDPSEDDFAPLPASLLRKYIAYARTYVFPRMSKPAAEIIQKFYLQLRDHSTSADSTPITARQLESLVRLAEARARLELREEVTAQDAMDVIEMMKESLYDKYVDEHGFVDFGRSGGMSKQKEAKRFLSALNKQSELQQKDTFSISEIYSLADRIGLRVPDIDTFVDNLNSVGYLLKKGAKTYQVLSSSYSRSQPSRG